MVSIVPNQFRIEGVVTAKEKDPQREAFCDIHVRLDVVEHITGPEAFLEKNTKEVVVSVADTVAEKMEKGTFLNCRIRKVPGHFFLIPDSLETGNDK